MLGAFEVTGGSTTTEEGAGGNYKGDGRGLNYRLSYATSGSNDCCITITDPHVLHKAGHERYSVTEVHGRTTLLA